MVRRAGDWFQHLNINSDPRKRVVVASTGGFSVDEFGKVDLSVNGRISLRPLSNLSVSVGPSYSRDATTQQYVTAVDDSTAGHFFGKRYVFGELVQRSLSMDTRVALTLSPTLSFELFAQPFISSGEYSAFREFVAPRSGEMKEYGRDRGTITAEPGSDDTLYRVDPDGAGPAGSFTFTDPDFNFRSLRGNAVMRWEWRPGSTLFLVWQQSRSHDAPFGDLDFARDRAALFAARPDNVFLIKASYWLPM